MAQDMQAAIDDLISTVDPLTDAVQAQGALIDQMIVMIEAAADDPMQVRTVADQLRARRDEIVEATLRGTTVIGGTPPAAAAAQQKPKA